MARGKKKTPARVFPVSLLAAVAGATVSISVLTGGLAHPLGAKGEGLLLLLLLYLVFRAAFALTVRLRGKNLPPAM